MYLEVREYFVKLRANPHASVDGKQTKRGKDHMSKTVVSSARVYIDELISPVTEWKDFSKIFNGLQKEVMCASTKAIAFCNIYKSYVIHQGKEAADKWMLDNYGKDKPVSAIYHPVSKECDSLYKSIAAAFSREIYQKYFSGANSYSKQIDKGTGNPPMVFTNSIPIPLIKKDSKIQREEGASARKYICSFKILSRRGQKKYEEELGKTEISSLLEFVTNAKDNQTYRILENIVSGNYELCASKLIRKRNRNRYQYYIQISYKHPVREKSLDPNKVMGVDLGIVVPAMCATNYDERYCRSFGGRKIIMDGILQEKRNRLYQKDITYNGRDGHGRKAKLDGWDGKGHIINNRNGTYNHQLSKQIVEQAVKWECGTIHIEDLSKIKGDNTDKFLKHWTYYDLQSKIEYKAEKEGIAVVKIDPAYTSQKCSKCGFTCKENRPRKEKGQAYFRCIKCGYEANADYNAARNIALYQKI